MPSNHKSEQIHKYDQTTKVIRHWRKTVNIKQRTKIKKMKLILEEREIKEWKKTENKFIVMSITRGPCQCCTTRLECFTLSLLSPEKKI